jgi:hypothetical protein
MDLGVYVEEGKYKWDMVKCVYGLEVFDTKLDWVLLAKTNSWVDLV